jgi:hypothetical protein
MVGMPDGDVASPDGALEVRGNARVRVMELTLTIDAFSVGRAVTGEVVGFWLHTFKAHDWFGRRGTMVGVSVRQGWSLTSVECG